MLVIACGIQYDSLFLSTLFLPLCFIVVNNFPVKWMKEKLEEAGLPCVLTTFPDPITAREPVWKGFVTQCIGVDENTVSLFLFPFNLLSPLPSFIEPIY